MKIFSSLVLLAALSSTIVPAFAVSEAQNERINAAFVLALGRAPTAAESERWGKEEKLLIADLVARLQAQGESAVDRACADAFGRGPTDAERQAWAAGRPTYTALMKQHVQWLAGHPEEYAKVIGRSYQLVLGRAPIDLEITYWQAQPPLSFVLLNGCIENWARRNAPGLTVTSGRATVSVNSEWLTGIRLSPAVAAEARAAAGLFPAGDAHLAAATGRNVVAAGAGGVDSAGGIHFVAVGR
jgi:hypothetical protein